MAYSLSISLALGAANAGQTLSAQLFDTAGTNQGSAITTGFVERGANGTYLWTGSIPDDFTGAVEFKRTDTSAVLSVVSINPREVEYTDARVSSRVSLGATLAELSAGAPPATPTVEQALMLLYMALRNRMDTTSTALKFYNDGGSVIAQATLNDTGVLFTRQEMTAP